MPSNPRVRKAGRYVRRLPGYRYARRAILPRIRQSAGARSLVKRVFDVDAAQSTPLDVAPGTVVGGVGTERLPVVIVLMLGIPPVNIDPIIDEIAQTQLLTAGFRPVIVVDSPRFATARKYGYPTELFIPAHEWSDEHQSWEEYARAKLGRIIMTYRSSATVTVGPDGLDETNHMILASCSPS